MAITRRRYAQVYVTVAAATKTIPQFIATVDSDQTRTVKGVFLGINTAGVQLTVRRNGQDVSTWDASSFAAAGGYLAVNEDYVRGWEFEFTINNTTNAQITNVSVGFEYEVTR